MIQELQLRMDESPEFGVKRIGLALLETMCVELRQMDKPNANIHTTRKACKQFRALLRLVRFEIGEDRYKMANDTIRNAAGRLSLVRDTRVLIDTVEDLWEDYYDFFADPVFEGLRRRLKKRHHRLMQNLLQQSPDLDELPLVFKEMKGPVRRWTFEHSDFEAYAPGIKRVYKRGRKWMNQAWKYPTPENLHEWRKEVKYLYYHCGFLYQLWPEMMEVYVNSLGALQNLLGKDHDLALLSATMEADPKLYKDYKRRHILQHLIMQERRELQQKAWPLGYQLYQEAPIMVANRFASFYEARKMERE